jgi:hypothetical protein
MNFTNHNGDLTDQRGDLTHENGASPSYGNSLQQSHMVVV